MIEGTSGRLANDADACRRVCSYAENADDRFSEAISMAMLGGALWQGPTPVAEALRELQQRLTRAERTTARIGIIAGLAILGALEGRFDDARVQYREAFELGMRLGWWFGLASHQYVPATIELMAGDAAAAEREARWGYDRLTAGGHAMRAAFLAPFLAEALYEQERYAEAERFATEGERAAVGREDEVDCQLAWRRVRARLLARRGDFVGAVALAAEAVRLAEPTDALTWRADAQFTLARVLREAGRNGDASEAAREALLLYEEKGNLVGAERARALIREIEASTSVAPVSH
jgi:ATP/maltotriose-dependent transcriptional regulator MalT